MKLFKTGSIDVVEDCESYFAIDLPSCDLKRRQDKFIVRNISTGNGFCQKGTDAGLDRALYLRNKSLR